jgi:TolB-like protein
LKRYRRRPTGFCCLIMSLFIFSLVPALAQKNVNRVLILPLTIHSEKDLTFLNKGIMDMMASRISQSATVIRRAGLDPDKDPVQIARDLNADYVVTGSLTVFGNSASTDAALTEVASGDTVLPFSQFGQNSGDALKHINQFATQASQYIASRSDAAPRVAAPSEPAPAVMIPQVAAPVQPVQPPPPAVVAPPQAPVLPVPASAPVIASTAAAGSAETTADDGDALWTSNPFKGTISALATGDVDGDGRPDIVFCHENRVVAEHRDGERLTRLAAFDAGRRHTIIALDTGDINKNGITEIFVTRLDAHNQLDSVVLEWNGSGLQAIATGQRWYFRAGDDPENGRTLMGQRRGIPSSNDTGGLYADAHFMPGVFEMTWNGKNYQAGRRLPLPDDMNLYRFARGDIFNDGAIRAIGYSVADKLRIYDPTGAPQWAGEETLGGNPIYLEAASFTDVRTKDRTYLTQRFITADLDGDGKIEVVTVHNRDAAKGFVERFRKYTRGQVIALRWNKVNMKEVWTGEEVSGYISDFSLADLNGDGRLEAIYAMVTSTGITQAKSSNIVVEQIGNLSGK